MCRSRVLLHYFADESDDCGHCDVCINRRNHPKPIEEADIKELMERYTKILSDGLPHKLMQLPHDDFSTDVHKEVLRRLIVYELVKLDRDQVEWTAKA